MRMDEVVKALMDWAQQFPEELERDEDTLRSKVREALFPLKKTQLNIYWSRNAVGVKIWSDEWGFQGKDEVSFSFNCSSAPRRLKLGVAVRCAELCAPCLVLSCFL